MIEITLAYDKKEDIRVLFTEYTKMLIANDATVAKSLELQNYDEEIDQLEKKYGGSGGRLYIAYVDGQPAGCMGFHRFNDNCCELKRLYVRDKYRRHHIATLLFNQIFKDVKEIGYKKLVLDTLPFLREAIVLYKKYGFYKIPAYYDTPVTTTIFMEKTIQ